MAVQQGNAGQGAREMALKRYHKMYFYVGGMVLACLILFTNLNNIAKLGLPVVIAVFVAVRVGMDLVEKKALHHKKRAKDAERGAKAEVKVANRLGDLPDGYFGFHDIAFNGFNIDHVVLGPGGIFLIETKSHRGKVEAKGDSLILNGHPTEKDFIKQTWSQTFSLKDFLWKMTSKQWEIKPVLCFANAYVGVRRPVKGIVVTNLGYLNKYLAKQPPSLSPEDIERIGKFLSPPVS